MIARFAQRGSSWIAAFVCLVFVAGLRDWPPIALQFEERLAPPVPDAVGERDGELRALIVDSDNKPVPGARLTVLLIRDNLAYLARAVETGADGRVVATKLPRGEVWVLVDAKDSARSSSHILIGEAPKELRMTLRVASALSVHVIDDEGAGIDHATVELRCADPLPFVKRTNAKGDAKLMRLCPPPFTVKVSAEGHEEVVRQNVTVGPQALRVTMRKLGSLLVNVVGPDGQPAPLSTVFLSGATLWPARQTDTNAFGRSVIGSLPPGTYDLRAIRANLVSPTSAGVTVARGKQSQVDLKLGAGHRVNIEVVEADSANSAPVVGASVVLAEDGISAFPFEGRTGSEGKISLGPVGLGAHTVSVRAEGFVPATAVSDKDSENSLRIALIRGGRLLGEVVDDRGFGVPGASIEVVGSDLLGMPIDETPSLHAFRATHFSWALAGPPKLIAAGELGVMPGPIPPIPHGTGAAALAGLIRPAGEAPPAEPWVSDRHGEFSVGPISPGHVRAIARHPAYVEGASELVTLSPGGQAKVKVILVTGGTLEGRVLDERRFPIPGARVQVTAVRGTTERSTVTADDGTFVFAVVPSDLILTVSRPLAPEEAAYQSKLTIGEGKKKEVEIILRAEREPMEVRVSDDRGYPIETAQVSVVSLSTESSLRRTGFTGTDGSTKILDALGLAVRVEVSAPGYGTQIKVLDSAPKEWKVALNKGLQAKGRITTRGGRDDLSDAQITMWFESGTRHLLTDKKGSYSVRDLSPGTVRIRVDRKGYVPVEKTVELTTPRDADRPIELDPIDLAEGGTAEGEVVDERGDPIVGARIGKDAIPNYLPPGPLPPGIVASNARGEFSLDGLPEGRVLLEAYSPGYGRGKIENVEIRAGRTASRLRITIKKGQGIGGTDASGGVLVSLRESRGQVEVSSVSPSSQAERAGLLPGDRILKVDGQAVSSVQEAQNKLAGPERQDVLVDIEREKRDMRLRVSRERIRR